MTDFLERLKVTINMHLKYIRMLGDKREFKLGNNIPTVNVWLIKIKSEAVSKKKSF